MKNRTLSLRALLGAALLFWLAAIPLSARTHQSEQWADSQFATASHLRDTLETQSEKQRTRHAYQRVIDAYRRVYFGAPTSTKADPSAAAVADLLLELGHQFHDEKILRSAIKQYEFLRKEYPGSRSRFEALLTIGQIYKNDLNNPDKANDAFREFLHRYPNNELAAAAKMALAEPQPGPKTQDAGAQSAVQQSDEKTAASVQKRDAEDTDHPSAPQVDASDDSTTITDIHYRTKPDSVAVTIDLSRDVKYDVQKLDHPDRIYFDLFDTKLSKGLNGKSIEVNHGLLKQVRAARFQPGRARIVLEVSPQTTFKVSAENHPARLVINLRENELQEKKMATTSPAKVDESAKDDSKRPASNELSAAAGKPEPLETAVLTTTEPTAQADTHIAEATPIRKVVVEADADDVAKPESAAKENGEQTSHTSKSSRSANHGRHLQTHAMKEPVVHEAIPTADGDRSLIRALGLKIGRIVIDPGHGGHDTGTIGPHGLLEKDLVLDVSKRLDKLLESRLGADVVLTRSDDTFIPLEQRTEIANEEQADLFISVHANSSHDADARGVETYYLNFTSSPEALEVVARENAVSDKSIHQLQDLVKTIALKEKIEESHEFAFDVQEALHNGLSRKNPGIRDRGVKKAPFIVLIGAHMPSILAEISFVSNPGDERRLRTPAYRQRIAESLYQGVAKYVRGLSGVKVASKVDKSEGQ